MLTGKSKCSRYILLAILMIEIASCMSLEKVSIANLRLEYDKKQLRVKGTSLPIGVSVVTSDQKRLTTRGFSHGKLKWSNFNIAVEGGKFSHGKIVIPSSSASDSISVKIVSKHHPEWGIKEVIVLNHLLDIKASIIEPVVWAPDESFKINLDSYYDNGQVYPNKLTTNLIKQMGLKMEVEGGEFSGSKFHIFEDFEKIQMHTIFVKLKRPGKPELADSFYRRLDYIKKYMYIQSELSAWSGKSGSDGFSGSHATNDGEHGKNGNHGEYGYPGENGKNGHDIDVFIDAYSDSILNTDLVYVEVNDLSFPEKKKYLINPNGGGISIQSFGGNGGDGGPGGNGGSGGNGGKGKEIKWEVKDSTGVHYFSKTGHGGRGGNGGDAGYGGNGGDGGRGGDIYIHYTARAKSYLSILIPQSIGGNGGDGGRAGSAGSGGNGGPGNPAGSTGRPGNPGSNGNNGYPGPNGRIVYTMVDN